MKALRGSGDCHDRKSSDETRQTAPYPAPCYPQKNNNWPVDDHLGFIASYCFAIVNSNADFGQNITYIVTALIWTRSYNTALKCNVFYEILKKVWVSISWLWLTSLKIANKWKNVIVTVSVTVANFLAGAIELFHLCHGDVASNSRFWANEQ